MGAAKPPSGGATAYCYSRRWRDLHAHVLSAATGRDPNEHLHVGLRPSRGTACSHVLAACRRNVLTTTGRRATRVSTCNRCAALILLEHAASMIIAPGGQQQAVRRHAAGRQQRGGLPYHSCGCGQGGSSDPRGAMRGHAVARLILTPLVLVQRQSQQRRHGHLAPEDVCRTRARRRSVARRQLSSHHAMLQPCASCQAPSLDRTACGYEQRRRRSIYCVPCWREAG